MRDTKATADVETVPAKVESADWFEGTAGTPISDSLHNGFVERGHYRRRHFFNLEKMLFLTVYLYKHIHYLFSHSRISKIR